MYRKHFFIISAALAVLLLTTTATASAQVERLRGVVTLKQADGTMAPVEGAVVEVFRTDRGGNKDTKTDKKGNFTLVLDVAGDYVMAVSAPNAQPSVLRAKVREELYKVALEPGSGRRLTKDEVMALVNGPPSKGGGSGTPSATGTNTGTSSAATATTDTTPRLDETKNAEEKRKVEAVNETVNRTFKAGNEALKAKRYDDAITQYNEGLAADPEQYALLTNKAVALTNRGVERYNASIKSDDATLRENAKKDFKDAVDTATKAVELSKAATPATDPASQERQRLSKTLVLSVRADAFRLHATKGDPTQLDAAVAAYQEYIAAETNPVNKLAAELSLANILLQTGTFDKALAEYQKILETNPDNVDALRGAGIALFSTGDKTKYQEAANYLQRFVDKAPDTHPDKKDVQAILAEMKKENVTPQKTPSGRRRG